MRWLWWQHPTPRVTLLLTWRHFCDYLWTHLLLENRSHKVTTNRHKIEPPGLAFCNSSVGQNEYSPKILPHLPTCTASTSRRKARNIWILRKSIYVNLTTIFLIIQAMMWNSRQYAGFSNLDSWFQRRQSWLSSANALLGSFINSLVAAASCRLLGGGSY